MINAVPDCDPPPGPYLRLGQPVRVVGPDRAWKLGFLGQVHEVWAPTWVERGGWWTPWLLVVDFELPGRRQRSVMEPDWLVGVE